MTGKGGARFAHDPNIFTEANRCGDFSAGCKAGPSHVGCWMRKPSRGWCPYLVTAGKAHEKKGSAGT